MAAAYGALTSVMYIIHQLQHHPRPPIFLDQRQVESLVEHVTFLLEFLEGYSNDVRLEADDLEIRIAYAAYAAEDIIESYIVDRILSRSTSQQEENISSVDFYQGSREATSRQGENISSVEFNQGLQRVIQDMDSIKTEAGQIKEKMGVQGQLRRNSTSASTSKSPLTSSSKSLPTRQNTIVGVDDDREELLDKLTGNKSELQIIPIVGMAGIGKTTLAKCIYLDSFIREHFHILSWVTISQECTTREFLLEILHGLNKGSRVDLSQMSEENLRERLHKTLYGRRYLIVIDDIWSVEAWDRVKIFFPDNNNKSRIMITTRLSNVASDMSSPYVHAMSFLDESTGWRLFCRTVFHEDDCPIELEQIGRRIVKNCKGLPLAIVVIGGLLEKFELVREYWEYVAQNLNTIVNLENDEYCLRILYLSYNELPVHLKPCFLYMRVFPSEREIRVSELIKLWVAEGFLKPISGQSLEVVAENYLMDLVGRNLIIAEQWGSNGKLKFCNIHGLLRDLCLRDAERVGFLYVTRPDNANTPQGTVTQRRIGVHKGASNGQYLPEVLNALQSASLNRSLICHFQIALPPLSFRLLRLLKAVDKHLYSGDGYSLEYIFQMVNSRYVSIRADWIRIFPPSIYLLWNLQTLIVKANSVVTAPPEFWKMPLLRHVEFDRLELPDPPNDQLEGRDDIVLGNLQTLLKISNFKCSEEVVNRIPNIKKLQISYKRFKEGSDFCLNNLGRLHILESLVFFLAPAKWPSSMDLRQNLTFPYSLKKLTLEGSFFDWEDMAKFIGPLPVLEVLKLRDYSYIGREWKTVEGQFCSLKYLLIFNCPDLEYWTTDYDHFPRLEHLVLRRLFALREIPSEFGDIPTLQSIQVENCRNSVIKSAKLIQQQQEELGNLGLRVQVDPFRMH